jgi:hypothetical protein
MRAPETNKEPDSALALAALGWLLADNVRASRLLAVTGLTPERLRGGLEDPALLGAILAFLEAHEPDLTACADALNVAPTQLVAARAVLER